MNTTRPMKSPKRLDLEVALVELGEARDERGNLVRLFSGEPTAANLRNATRVFAVNMFEESVYYFGGTLGEAYAHANLAKLAHATACAMHLEARP